MLDNRGSLITIGSDRCLPLVQDAQKNVADPASVNEVAVADALASGFRAQVFDYALSIATIHHFSTEQRRKQSVQELIRIVAAVAPQSVQGTAGKITGSGTGRFMIYVWALEQRGDGRRHFDTALAEQGNAAVQDVLVPWVSTGQHVASGVHERCAQFLSLTRLPSISRIRA